MTTTLAFFSNKGGVGKTTLVYHLAHMFADMGRRVLLLDLDPQCKLTEMCLSEDSLLSVWREAHAGAGTSFGCLHPLMFGPGDVRTPEVIEVSSGVQLLPGHLGLSTFDDPLSEAWSGALGGDDLAFRRLSAFHSLALSARRAEEEPELVLIDTGVTLSPINRAALLASDFIVTTLSPDVTSIQGLQNLGTVLHSWRTGWQYRVARNPDPLLPLPPGRLLPLGYVAMQTRMRRSQQMGGIDYRGSSIAEAYASTWFGQAAASTDGGADPSCLGVMRHYHTLMPLALDAQRPMFHLRPADGAIGSRMDYVRTCAADIRTLARSSLDKIDAPAPA